MITLADMDGNESFTPEMLGTADEVIEERIADDHLIIKGGKTSNACSVLLRGANMHMLDEVERSLHDALCAIKRALESASVVPGGGCVEAALSIAASASAIVHSPAADSTEAWTWPAAAALR